MGTRSSAFNETVRFFQQTLDLPIGNRHHGFVRFDLADAGSVEVFDAASGEYPHFSTGPVVGFDVEDFDQARYELERKGFSMIAPSAGEPGNYRWQHFRGPDNLVFEIVDYPGRPLPNPPVGRLQATKLVWMGISTPNFSPVAQFFQEVLGLPVEEETADLLECRLPDGSSVEAFRRGSEVDHPHFRTGPVPGIGVVDIDEAVRILRTQGTTPLESRHSPTGGWAHIRAPDGNVYELKQSALGYQW